VDTENHLIVTHEVTNVGSDRQQLKKVAEAAREALGTETLTAIADRGYYNGEQIKACEDAGIVPLIPKGFTSTSRADGRYDKSDFVYIAKRDAYRCPAGEYAIRRYTATLRECNCGVRLPSTRSVPSNRGWGPRTSSVEPCRRYPPR
jgi:hypothetical protein